ncbi:MAG: beta-propeller fold lactonase family protein, partial [Neglectibacter timonensis]
MKYRLFASSYTGGKPGDGIYALEFDGEQLRYRDVCAELVNPSYIQPDGDRLFAVEETENGAAMAVFETEKGLALQARYETPGSGMCHVTRCGACLYGS